MKSERRLLHIDMLYNTPILKFKYQLIEKKKWRISHKDPFA